MDKNNSQNIACKYASLNRLWGLWESEKYAITKYCSHSDKIIDIGCGAGRISINLYELGYKNITGVDILESMIIQAQKETPEDYKIYYCCNDIVNAKFNATYNVAIFSYNGLMSIIGHENRQKALKNIANHLENGGVFIFTTHLGIEDPDSQYFDFWQKRENFFINNNQPIDDVFFTLTVEDKGVSINQFFAKDKDIENDLKESGFTIIETFRRNDRFQEKDFINESTNDCRFWICKKST